MSKFSDKDRKKNEENDIQEPSFREFHAIENTVDKLHKNCREIETNHLNDMIKDDLVIYKVRGDGACFYSSCAAHIYRDENQFGILRMIFHQFIVDNWWFFSDFFPFPYVATIGVGENFHSVCINNVRELHSFLLSPDSMKCWIDSQIDHSVIANMFGINVFTYVYNCQDSPPVWQMTSPDPILTN